MSEKSLRQEKEMLETRVLQLQAELARQNEEMAAMTAREVSPADMGIGGRVALTRLRDQDWPDFIRAVDNLPRVYRKDGYWGAMNYARTNVRSKLDALTFRPPRTGMLVRLRHRIHMLLEEGMVDVMFRPDRAGERARLEFKEVAERYCYALSVQASFERGAETPAGLLPTMLPPGGEG